MAYLAQLCNFVAPVGGVAPWMPFGVVFQAQKYQTRPYTRIRHLVCQSLDQSLATVGGIWYRTGDMWVTMNPCHDLSHEYKYHALWRPYALLEG